MLKKIFILSGIFWGSVSTVFAAWASPSLYIAPSIIYQSIVSGKVEYEGLSARLALGIGGVFNDTPVYLGAEIFGIPKSMTLNNNRNNTPGLRPQYSLGGSIIPGICLDAVVMAYLRLGMMRTSFTNLETSRNGFQIGAGGEVTISDNWSARGEYVYTRYTSITQYDIGSPKIDEFNIGLIYRFG